MRHDEVVIAVAGSFIAALWLTMGYLASRRAKTIRSLLAPMVRAAGWSGVEDMFAIPGVKGVWRSMPARLFYQHRRRSAPARLTLTARSAGVSGLIVQRRTKYLLRNRPLTWFGPPLIEVHHPPAGDLWVRADEPAFAERVFGDERLVAMISRALTGAFDEVRIGRKGVRITRALPYEANGFRPDASVIESAARDEVAIADSLIGKIA